MVRGIVNTLFAVKRFGISGTSRLLYLQKSNFCHKAPAEKNMFFFFLYDHFSRAYICIIYMFAVHKAGVFRRNPQGTPKF